MPNAQTFLTEIQSLTNDTSGANRRELLRRVTDLFFLTSNQHTPDDTAVFGDVMERIAYELDVEARAELSERLCTTHKAPHKLVCRLAGDAIDVARPVLERSKALTDIDLIKIAKTEGQSHLFAIAKRAALSASVTDMVIERGESSVHAKIAGNKAAELTNASVTILVRKACTDSEVRDALAKRADLFSDLLKDITTPEVERNSADATTKQRETQMTHGCAQSEDHAGLDPEAPSSSGAALRECLNKLADLCASGRKDKSAELLDRIVDLYFITAEKQSVSERAAFGGLMARLANASDSIVRVRLAERFACVESAPVSLLRKLARDEISVARPVLQYSACLGEGDLVSIASEGNQEHLLAAAHRCDLTIPVTDILIQRGGERVHQAIVNNLSAEFSGESIEKLKQVGEDDEFVQRILHMRGDVASNPIGRLRRLTTREFLQNVT